MFAKETYMQRRALLKKNLGSGVLLFLGNDECGLNYEDNTFRYRQDSTFLYYFGLSCAGLSAIIDIDEDNEIIFRYAVKIGGNPSGNLLKICPALFSYGLLQVPVIQKTKSTR